MPVKDAVSWWVRHCGRRVVVGEGVLSRGWVGGGAGMLAAVALGQLSNLMGCLTTYGIGSAPPYFGAGYVPQSKWYQFGLLLSFFYIAVWLGVGGAWWKVIGLY